jgi:hypothetical protein
MPQIPRFKTSLPTSYTMNDHKRALSQPGMIGHSTEDNLRQPLGNNEFSAH